MTAYLTTPPHLPHTIPTMAGAAPPTLDSLRSQIGEQFDIEILLKHREIYAIEAEIAKTQVALEQLRRVQTLPYADSPEAQLLHQLNYNPLTADAYAPPPEGVVDGPYTRHYRQWLLRDARFDQDAPPYVAPGRPQRASAVKVQTKTGEQVCLYRRRDGVLVR